MKKLLIALLVMLPVVSFADPQRLEIVSRERSVSKMLDGDTVIVKDTKTQCEFIIVKGRYGIYPSVITKISCPEPKKEESK